MARLSLDLGKHISLALISNLFNTNTPTDVFLLYFRNNFDILC